MYLSSIIRAWVHLPIAFKKTFSIDIVSLQRDTVTDIEITTPNRHDLIEAFDNDKELVIFFLEWLKQGQNASKAYMKLHPDVDEPSAAVLGSRKLKKVNIGAIMETYGLGLETYLIKLKEGLEATKVVSARIIMKKDHPTSMAQDGSLPDATSRTDDFVEVPDYAVRKQYHDKVGKLLGIEKDGKIMGFQLKDGEKEIRVIVEDFTS